MEPHRQLYRVLRMQPGWLILPPIPDYKLTGLKRTDDTALHCLGHFPTTGHFGVTFHLKQSLLKVQAAPELLIRSPNLPQHM